MWRVTFASPSAGTIEVTASALVNATGPWVKEVRDAINGTPSAESVRHIKGSHIVVPRVHRGEHAYILQNADKRIVFVIPFEDRYSLIGTTDVPVETFERPLITSDEIDYLLRLANSYLARPLTRDEVVWTYSGVRPLYDDGSEDPSAITRDYVLKLDAGEGGGALALSIYGGKITTYRKLAEQVLDELAPAFPAMQRRWTQDAVLPGGDLPVGGAPAPWNSELARRYPGAAGRNAPRIGAAAWNASPANPRRRERARRSRRRFWPRVVPRRRSPILFATNGRVPPTTCSGAEPNAASA